MVYPALQSLIARWAPPAEKGKFVAALMGNTLGTVITWSLLGFIIQSMGWIWAFIIPAIIAAGWSVLWCFTVADAPSDHKFISEEERDYIDECLGTVVKKTKVHRDVNFYFRSMIGYILENTSIYENVQKYPFLGVGGSTFRKSMGFVFAAE